MVAGKVYEGNCWTKYQHLYYDAWWSPINYSDGSYKAWDTAGKQGGDDVVYDFTQLIDGKLVFVGCKNTQNSGVWSFVTDSSGKNILWEKTSILPGKDAGGYSLSNLLPLSVCQTSDSGFTIVGENNTYGNNYNAFAMHFVPTPGISIAHTLHSSKPTVNTCRIIGTKAVFSFKNYSQVPERVSIYSVDGKRVMDCQIADRQKAAGSFELDLSGIGKGVYLYTVKAEQCVYSGSFVIEK